MPPKQIITHAIITHAQDKSQLPEKTRRINWCSNTISNLRYDTLCEVHLFLKIIFKYCQG